MKVLSAGVIGLGIGEKHLQAYDAHPDVKVEKICDFNQDKLKELERKYPDLQLTTNPDDILTDSSIDIVSIASYDNYHYEQIIEALNNNINVFVEKPMCLQEDEAVNIRKLLNLKQKLHFSSNLPLRTFPRFIRLKEAINSGEMGDLYTIQGDYLWGRIDKLTTGWRKDMPFYSIIYGAAVHMVDLVIWLTGLLPIEVKGYGNQISTRNSEMRYNDYAALLLKFENELVIEITAHGGCVYPHYHQLQIYGTKKTFINNINGGVWINSCDPNADTKQITEEYPGKNQRVEVINSFIDSIIDNSKEPIVKKNDVFNTMSVCFAAEKSIKTNTNIAIKYI